jgi:hypothetical protein
MNSRSSSSCRFESCRAVPGCTISTLPRSLVTLRLVTFPHVDRERPVEDDEDLLLDRVDVPPPYRAPRVAVQVRARPRHRVRELGGEPGVALAPRMPLQLPRMEDRVRHAAILSRRAGCGTTPPAARWRRGSPRQHLGVEIANLVRLELERDVADHHLVALPAR